MHAKISGIPLLVAAVVLTTALMGCGRSQIDVAEDDFVSGCSQGGAPASICSCVFDSVVDTYGKERVLSLASSGWGRVPPDFGRVVAHASIGCRASS